MDILVPLLCNNTKMTKIHKDLVLFRTSDKFCRRLKIFWILASWMSLVLISVNNILESSVRCDAERMHRR